MTEAATSLSGGQGAAETREADAAAPPPAAGAVSGGGAQIAAADGSADKGAAGTGDAGSADVTGEFSWPEDWRERHARSIAGKDDAAYEKALGRLKRFASPDNVVRSLFEADAKIRSGAFKRSLPDNPSDAELAQFRKEMGVPENADGYDFSKVEGLSETDGDVLKAFRPVFHGENLTPGQAEKLVGAYKAYEKAAIEQRRTFAIEKTAENRATIRAEFGREYDQNRHLAMQWMDGVIGADKRNAIAELTLADGTKLADHPDFIRLTVQAARAVADDGTLAAAELGAGSGKSLDEQYREALDLGRTDPKAYAHPDHQAKLIRLIKAREKRSAA